MSINDSTEELWAKFVRCNVQLHYLKAQNHPSCLIDEQIKLINLIKGRLQERLEELRKFQIKKIIKQTTEICELRKTQPYCEGCKFGVKTNLDGTFVDADDDDYDCDYCAKGMKSSENYEKPVVCPFFEPGGWFDGQLDYDIERDEQKIIIYQQALNDVNLVNLFQGLLT